jgi:penicillin-binding protein 1C
MMRSSTLDKPKRCRIATLQRCGKFGLAVAAVAVAIGAVFWGMLPVGPFPRFAEVRSSFAGSEFLLLDRHGEIIHQLRSDPSRRRLDWVPLDGVSPAMRSAIVAAEDRRFFRHNGVDWLSLAAAAANGFRSQALRGASTVSMQLAALLDQDLRPHGRRRSITEKISQLRGATELERRWSKTQILEAYLNLVTFRGELQGIAAAARGLFRKEPQGLTQAESLVLAALVRAPNAEPERVLARVRLLSEREPLRTEPLDIGSAARQAFAAPYLITLKAALAPHVALRLMEAARTQTGQRPSRVTSTLDAGLQRFASEALSRHLLTVRTQNVHDGAVLVIENRTGDVLAYVGNTGEHASARFVDGVQASRQAGSTLKPFIYAAAFDRRLLTPASLLDDSPLEMPVQGGGVYRPRNYDQQFRGLVTARIALASSLNVPAVRTLNLVGVETAVEELTRLGFRNLHRADYYGPSLALGAADVTLWDLTNAYRALANGGIAKKPHLSLDGEPHETIARVFSEAATFLVSDILSDRESRSGTFNLESPLATRFWTAVKTGTSKDMRDNWCIGYSDRYTVGVWAGNFAGDPMWNVTGITGAAPVWVEIMNWLHNDRTSRPPAEPADVVSRVVAIPGLKQVRRERFLSGTETVIVRESEGQGRSRIVYPTAGMVVVLDPDIPPDQQRVMFQAEQAGRNVRWVLDGQSNGSADARPLWAPVGGRHKLALVDEFDRVLDEVSFVVR